MDERGREREPDESGAGNDDIVVIGLDAPAALMMPPRSGAHAVLVLSRVSITWC